MTFERKFLGWDQPFLPRVAELLLADCRTVQSSANGPNAATGQADLSHVIAVVPGRRAGRRLLEILIDQTADLPGFVPPQIETLGRLPERLYEPQRPFAPRTVQILAWVQALQSVDPAARQVIARQWPGQKRFSQWRDLGELLWKQHRELAADGLSFEDVRVHGSQLPGFPDAERWQALAEVQEGYLQILDDLQLWDRQTARLVAIKNHECQTEQRVVLIGTADIGQALRAMLEQVSEQVQVLVFAPLERADRFDALGCLVPRAWAGETFDIPDDRLVVAERAEDQALLLAEALQRLSQSRRVDEITVGMPDERLVPHCRRTLDLLEVGTRWFEGRTLAETPPFQFLRALGQYLATRGYRELAALVRHPHIESWAAARSLEPGWLEQLDDYFGQHLPTRIGFWLGTEPPTAAIRTLVTNLDETLSLLPSGIRPWTEWSTSWLEVLASFYEHLEFDRSDPAQAAEWQALSVLCEQFQRVAELPESLVPEVTSAEALQLILSEAARQPIAAPHDPNAIEMLGWLELPLDDRPSLIVTSFNEGVVPASVNSDLFLPNRLRMHLGIDDNQRRFARDAFALRTLLESRPDFTLICSRSDSDGNPQRPSRLLLATDNTELPHRVLKLVASEPAGRRLRLDRGGTGGAGLVLPKPEPLREPVSIMSVTSFRDYLACPYRFYLKHVLKLQSVDDQLTELSPAHFGSLVHDVLEHFGRSDCRDSEDPQRITEFLHDYLAHCVERDFGRHRLAAVEIQLASLRLRLQAFAQWQAAQPAEGWSIWSTELMCKVATPLLKFADQQMLLSGKIDRIDYHDGDGRWRILDYKTSESGEQPERTHRSKNAWKDLQLPLYRHLLPDEVQADESELQLGYVVLPKSIDGTGLRLAGWTEELLVEADKVARDVADCVRRQQFWPPADPPPRFDDFARLCSSPLAGTAAALTTHQEGQS